MNPKPSDNPLWQEHMERVQRLHRGTRAKRTTPSTAEAELARRGEWTAPPPGRLGRLLLAEIESYLAFFAIARAD